jgi:H+/Cl- antiporter ClcA
MLMLQTAGEAHSLGSLTQFAPAAGVGSIVALAIGIAHIVLQVALALGVAAHSEGRKLQMLGRPLWILCVLLSGPLGLLAYWIVNVSALSAPRDPD